MKKAEFREYKALMDLNSSRGSKVDSVTLQTKKSGPILSLAKFFIIGLVILDPGAGACMVF
jgi:hypothetical protein